MIKDKFIVKPESIVEPTSQLGADINKVYYNNGSFAWLLGSTNYAARL